jgi:predicted RNase H-like HicB family nuclease
MIRFPAVFEYDRSEKVYNIHFPDIEGCYTFGGSIEKAKRMAREALT